MSGIQNPKALPRGGVKSQALVRPSGPKEINNTTSPSIAGVGKGAGTFEGLGVGAMQKSSALGKLVPLKKDDLGQISYSGPSPDAAFACSLGAIAFLQNHVASSQDFEFISREGWVNFDRTVGRHQIPLQVSNGEVNGAKKGSIAVSEGMVFVVTHFEAFADVPNVGLPGAFIPVDPSALNGFVCFNLLQSTGSPVFSQISVVNGETCNGISILDHPAEQGGVQTTATANASVNAYYEVMAPPFPGFPARVGVKVSGYLLNQVLIQEALNNPYKAGG